MSQSVSIRNDLGKSLGPFLRKEKIVGRKTKDVLISVVCQLVHHKEEGQQLFPEILLFDDLTSILKSLPNSEHVVVGVGPMVPESLTLALKRCAPLAQWGWSIYLTRMREEEKVEYGLLRCGLTALSLSASELLFHEGHGALPAILISHVSQSTIQVSGAHGNSLRIHFGAVEEPRDDPVKVIKRFCASVVRGVPIEVREPVSNFYSRLLSAVLRSGHGCLVAVLSRKKAGVSQLLKDGVVINPALDVASKVSSLLRYKSCEYDTTLRAAAALIRGMLISDGITVFGPDGSVRVYNVFVKIPKRLDAIAGKPGGARRRAFEFLCSRVGRELKGSLIISQDGHADFRGV
jgi:hypothetical protein